MTVVFSGGTVAPFGGLNDDGWRLRAVLGYGRYSYSGRQLSPPGQRHLTFSDHVAFADAMLGYQRQFGALTAKGFLGLAVVDHDPSLPDTTANVSGSEFGPKLQVELWHDPGGINWTALNASYTTAHDTYALDLRSGFRLSDRFSVGTQLTIDNQASDAIGLKGAYARGGAFLRYTWASGEFSVSGGVAVDLDDDPASMRVDTPTEPYAGVNWLTKF